LGRRGQPNHRRRRYRTCQTLTLMHCTALKTSPTRSTIAASRASSAHRPAALCIGRGCRTSAPSYSWQGPSAGRAAWRSRFTL
jgi:hypothetical protein